MIYNLPENLTKMRREKQSSELRKGKSVKRQIVVAEISFKLN